MKEESLLLLSDLQKLINQVVLIDYTIIILGDDALKEDGKFGADSQAFAKNHNLWSGQKYHCPTAIKWLRRTLHDVYSFTKLDTDYGKWTSYLSKCVKVFQKNRGLTQDAYVGLLTTYRLLKG